MVKRFLLQQSKINLSCFTTHVYPVFYSSLPNKKEINSFMDNNNKIEFLKTIFQYKKTFLNIDLIFIA
jgi:hypothetical protein